MDFGGGYGGFFLCIAQAYPKVNVSIVDYIDMHAVQKRYLEASFASKVARFYEKVIDLPLERYDVLNASFSFSESSLDDRILIEKFILEQCNGVHIIFQNRFNGIDNHHYMSDLLIRLNNNDWRVKILKYEWYGWSNSMLLVGQRNQIIQGVGK